MAKDWAIAAAKQAKVAKPKAAPFVLIPVLREGASDYYVQFRQTDLQSKTIQELAGLAEEQMCNVDIMRSAYL